MLHLAFAAALFDHAFGSSYRPPDPKKSSSWLGYGVAAAIGALAAILSMRLLS